MSFKIIDVVGKMKRSYIPSQRKGNTITTIVIHHDAASLPKPGNELARLKSYSNMHNAEGMGGIGYHYAIAPDGTVYKCAKTSWKTNHAKGGNSNSIGVMLFGNFEIIQPTAAQLQSAKELCQELRAALITIDKVIAHRNVAGSRTVCPGKNLTDSIISTW